MKRILALVIALVVSMLLGVPGSADEHDPFPADTIAVGLDESDMPNVDVTVELSRATFPDDGAQTVMIGRSDVFADSLASGVLQDEGPLLLVPTEGPVPAAVLAEIERLGASQAVVLGGEAAVSVAVADELAEEGLSVTRVAGPSRIETAVEVARRRAGASTAIIARAGGVEGNPTSGFADALAAGGWAAATGWPVLLTQTDVLTGSTRDYLADSGITSVNIVGGTAAVGTTVEQALTDMGMTVNRVAGSDRAATAVAIARARGVDSAADVARVVVVDGFSDEAWAAGFGAAAMSAGGAQPATRQREDVAAPIVLGNVDSLPPATSEFLVEGPEAITCAVTVQVCEQARLRMDLPPAVVVGGAAPLPELQPATIWADEVVAYEPGTGFSTDPGTSEDPVRALGQPDCPEEVNADSTCGLPQDGGPRGAVALGNGGSITLAFTDNSVLGDQDPRTPDLFLYEVGVRDEATRLTLISSQGPEVELFDETGSGACGSPAASGEDAVSLSGDISGIDIDCWLARADVGNDFAFDQVRITDVASEQPTTDRPTPGADIDGIGAVPGGQLDLTAWADAVESFEPGTGYSDGSLEQFDEAFILGPPDCPEDPPIQPDCGADQSDGPAGALSLGNGGSVTVVFTDNVLRGDGDPATADLIVVEIGVRDESTRATIIGADGAQVDLFDPEGSGACGSDASATGEDAYTFSQEAFTTDIDCWVSRADLPVDTVFDRVHITDIASQQATSNRPTPGADIDAVATRHGGDAQRR